MEAPLREIDPVLEAFAKTHGLRFTRNYRGEPERSLEKYGWIRSLLQIFPADDRGAIYKVWLCASQDRWFKRYWKRRFITESATTEDLKSNITSWLDEGYAELSQWSAKDLEFAGRLWPWK